MTDLVAVEDLARDVDYTDMTLPILTVYDHPADFPNHVVIRLWEGAWAKPTNVVKLCATLEDARAAIPPWFERLARDSIDDPTIVESYV